MLFNEPGLPDLYSIYRMKGEEYLVCFASEERIRLQAMTTNRTLRHTPDKFRSLVRSGELTLMKEASLPAIHAVAHSLSETQRKRFDRRRHYVEAVMEETSGNLSRVHFEHVIKKAADLIGDENPPSYATVARWINGFNAGGQTNQSFIDRHAFITKRSDRLDKVVERIIQVVIEEVLLKPECVRESYVYGLIKAKIHQQKEILGDDVTLKVPSLNTVLSRIDRIDVMQKIERRNGKYAARRLNQYGAKIFVEDYIGSRVEMDSNIVDVFVWDDQLKVAVRPLLTIVLDVPTRCVLGWELSLSSISAAKSMGALRDAMTFDDFCETKAIPYKLYVDNGCEFANEALKVSCDVLGITPVYCSPKSPNQKPHVERLFKTINDGFIHTLRGTTKSNPTQRGDYASEAEASLRIEDLRYLFRKYIHEVYHLTEHSSLGVTPLDKWRALVKERQPRVLSSSDAKHQFFIPRDVSINRGRVQAFNLQWTGPGLPTLQERLSRSRTKKKVRLLIDPDHIGTAYVIDPTNPVAPQVVRCVENEKFHQLSLRHWKWICDKAKSNAKNSTLADPVRLSRSILEIQRDIADATHANVAKGERKRAARKNAAKFANINIQPSSAVAQTALIAALPRRDLPPDSTEQPLFPVVASGLTEPGHFVAEAESVPDVVENAVPLQEFGQGESHKPPSANQINEPSTQPMVYLEDSQNQLFSVDLSDDIPLFGSSVNFRIKK